MKKESRFRISHLILSLVLLCVCGFIGYVMINSWIETGFHLLFLLYIPTFFLLVILPLWGSFGVLVEDIKKIKNGESTSLYADEENK